MVDMTIVTLAVIVPAVGTMRVTTPADLGAVTVAMAMRVAVAVRVAVGVNVTMDMVMISMSVSIIAMGVVMPAVLSVRVATVANTLFLTGRIVVIILL